MARDLLTTKEAILHAAEEAFAERGYAAASLQEIATAAGVSRGMPGYAFGSKAALYEAVLERSFAVPRSMVGGIPAALESGDPAEVFAGVVEAYIDFLAAHPRYVRLLQRAALDGGRAGGTPAHLGALEDALAGLNQLQAVEGLGEVDPRHLMVSVLGLCFFPFAHRDTLLAPLGLDADDPTFLAELKAHVVDLLLHGLIRR